jgi:hypothetical protein
MRLWVIIIIVAYALISVGCETDKGQKLGNKNTTATEFTGYGDYGLTSD